jgi:DNA-binding LacI/PurR family transcriptional regulator
VTVAGDRAQPTLVEVAALAGVSRATVSRVVNGSPRVSPTVRALVQRAIAELGYVPNRAAHSLVTRRADSIALVHHGYLDALRAAGAGTDDGHDLVEEGDFREESGEWAMRALLARRPDLDAVFAASDLMAAGALEALRAAGRRVPDDVAVVGFDDSALARWSEPPLTSVAQPVEEMGRQMAHLLLARIGGEATGLSVILQTELVVRESS